MKSGTLLRYSVSTVLEKNVFKINLLVDKDICFAYYHRMAKGIEARGFKQFVARLTGRKPVRPNALPNEALESPTSSSIVDERTPIQIITGDMESIVRVLGNIPARRKRFQTPKSGELFPHIRRVFTDKNGRPLPPLTEVDITDTTTTTGFQLTFEAVGKIPQEGSLPPYAFFQIKRGKTEITLNRLNADREPIIIRNGRVIPKPEGDVPPEDQQETIEFVQETVAEAIGYLIDY